MNEETYPPALPIVHTILDRPFGQHLGNRLQVLERDQIEVGLSV